MSILPVPATGNAAARTTTTTIMISYRLTMHTQRFKPDFCRQLQQAIRSLPLCAAILTTGCAMIGPDFKTPDAQVTDEWTDGDSAGISRQPSVGSEWWKIFNDPVLNNLIQNAYEQNLSLQIAGLRVLEARAQLGIVTGSLYPQSQSVSGNYSYNRGKETPFTDKYFSQAGTGFDAAWELD
ncbi:MAG: TolC family protein, partial [Gammaproteobacteria bacterium]|nr:TolC family protein [Gammaproteobacteria bacterium]